MIKKQLLGLAFSLLYVLAMIRPILPVLEYYANYDYIANELCINKDKPYLECNGKCYLDKELKKIGSTTSENQKAPSIDMANYPIATVTFFEISIPVAYQYSSLSKKIATTADFIPKSPYLKGTFHPPELNA